MAIALIGAVATLGSAYIQRPREVDEQKKEQTSELRSTSLQPTTLPRRKTLISVTGVQIGAAQDQAFVVEQRTTFGSSEEIAATIHYTATEDIRNFPARLTVSFGNPLFGQLHEEQIADVSTEGDSFRTFRFPSHERAHGNYLFLVRADGKDVYKQMIDIK